jgi:hypothetical protein
MEPSDDVKQFEIVCVSYESPGEVRQDSIDRNGSRSTCMNMARDWNRSERTTIRINRVMP